MYDERGWLWCEGVDDNISVHWCINYTFFYSLFSALPIELYSTQLLLYCRIKPAASADAFALLFSTAGVSLLLLVVCCYLCTAGGGRSEKRRHINNIHSTQE